MRLVINTPVLLRTAPKITQQTDSDMAVCATVRTYKFGLLGGSDVLLSHFSTGPLFFQPKCPLLLASLDTCLNCNVPAVTIICKGFPAAVSMPVIFRLRLHTSLKRSAGRPTMRLPVVSSPYTRSFGIRPSSMRSTWPSDRSRRWQSMWYMLREPAFSSTAVFGTLPCQVMPMMRRRQRRWKFSRRFSCLASVDQVDLDFGVLGQLIVVPHSLAQLGHDDSSFANVLVNFFVKRQVFGHSGAKVSKLVGDF